MITPTSFERDHSRQELTELIESARSGDQEALNVLISCSRAAIREQVASGFPKVLQARLDPSDVIQEVLLEASRDFPSFRGHSGREWNAWLERVLNNNVVECLRRHIDAEKRTLTREGSVENSFEGGRNNVPTDDSSPSQQAIRAELSRCLVTLHSGLEPDQQRILELRYWQGASLTKIASAMNLSKSGAARLLQKSLQILRKGLSKESSPHASSVSRQQPE